MACSLLVGRRDNTGKESKDTEDSSTGNVEDESGSAAMLAVELDDALGGAPTQHREVQENESQLFLSYFKTGVKYLPGGVKSGFTHYDPEDVEKRLFRVKGKKNVQVKQVSFLRLKYIILTKFDQGPT